MFAVHRGKPHLLDAILEAGASTEIKANGIVVIDQYVKSDKAIHAVHFKHERWRHLRKFLHLEE